MNPWAQTLITVRYYYDQKDFLNKQRRYADAPYHTAYQEMIDAEAQRLLEEKPSRSLRNYPFHGIAAMNIQKDKRDEYIHAGITANWADYFTKKDGLLLTATDMLIKNRTPVVAKVLNTYETLKVDYACKTDARMREARLATQRAPNAPRKKKEGPVTTLFQAYGEFRAQKNELKEKYIESVAPLQEQPDRNADVLAQKKAAYEFSKNRLRIATAEKLGLSDFVVDVLKGATYVGYALKLAA